MRPWVSKKFRFDYIKNNRELFEEYINRSLTKFNYSLSCVFSDELTDLMKDCFGVNILAGYSNKYLLIVKLDEYFRPGTVTYDYVYSLLYANHENIISKMELHEDLYDPMKVIKFLIRADRFNNIRNRLPKEFEYIQRRYLRIRDKPYEYFKDRDDDLAFLIKYKLGQRVFPRCIGYQKDNYTSKLIHQCYSSLSYDINNKILKMFRDLKPYNIVILQRWDRDLYVFFIAKYDTSIFRKSLLELNKSYDNGELIDRLTYDLNTSTFDIIYELIKRVNDVDCIK